MEHTTTPNDASGNINTSTVPLFPPPPLYTTLVAAHPAIKPLRPSHHHFQTPKFGPHHPLIHHASTHATHSYMENQVRPTPTLSKEIIKKGILTPREGVCSQEGRPTLPIPPRSSAVRYVHLISFSI